MRFIKNSIQTINPLQDVVPISKIYKQLILRGGKFYTESFYRGFGYMGDLERGIRVCLKKCGRRPLK